MTENATQFDEFVAAVQELDLEDRTVQATSHTAAVSVTDWDRIAQAVAADRQ